MRDNLIKNFNQETVMRRGIARPLDILCSSLPGSCHAFTISWLSLIFTGTTSKSATSRIKKLAHLGGNANRLLQNIYKSRVRELRRGGLPETHGDRMLLSLLGLKEDVLSFDYQVFTLNDLVDCIENPASSGFIYSFWSHRNAHTIGFFRHTQPKRGRLTPSEKYITVFDPNYGEYCIKATKFNDWFNKYKSHYNGISFGNITHHSVKFVSKK